MFPLKRDKQVLQGQTHCTIHQSHIGSKAVASPRIRVGAVPPPGLRPGDCAPHHAGNSDHSRDDKQPPKQPDDARKDESRNNQSEDDS